MMDVLLFTLCIPVLLGGHAVDYDCSWEILFVEFPGMMDYLYVTFGDETEPKEGHKILGLTVYSTKTIYLLRGYEGQETILGCTVLWHEVLHARGYSHEEMPLTPRFCPKGGL